MQRHFIPRLGVGVLILASAVSAAQQPPAAAPAPSAPTTTTSASMIVGAVKSGSAPLPGWACTPAKTLTGKRLVTTTRTDGTFRLTIPGRGRWVVRAELAAFALETKEIVFTPETLGTTQRADFELVLASRKQTDDTAIQQAANAIASGGFQSLGLNGSGAADSSGETGIGSLPAAAQGGDAATESVSFSGASGRTENFSFDPDQLNARIAEARANGQLGPGGGQAGGFGGGGFGGGGGAITVFGGRGGRRGRFDINKVHGQLFYNYGGSLFDAAPSSLLGAPADKPDYSQSRFGFSLGGPLKIPKLYNGGTKTMFFLNYAGQNAANPFDVFATVPPPAERDGDFSQTVFRSGPNAGQHV